MRHKSGNDGLYQGVALGKIKTRFLPSARVESIGQKEKRPIDSDLRADLYREVAEIDGADPGTWGQIVATYGANRRRHAQGGGYAPEPVALLARQLDTVRGLVLRQRQPAHTIAYSA